MSQPDGCRFPEYPGGVNKPIGQALDEVRNLVECEDVLRDVLPADALLARVDQASGDNAAELEHALPRLLELLVTNDLGSVPAWEITARLASQLQSGWSPRLRAAVLDVFDQWWSTILSAHPSRPEVGHALATLAALELPLSRWLQPLLHSLDGPAARHLADIVDGQLTSDGWSEHEDERQQILAWCRTDPVVMGLTLVGAVHLDEGHLGDLLDELL